MIILPTLLVLLCAALTLSYYGMMTRNAREQTFQTLRDSAREQRQTLAVKVEGQFAILQTFASALAQQESYDDLEDICHRMSAIVDSSDYTFLNFADTTGRGTRHDGMILFVSDRDYFQRSLAGEEAVQHVFDGRLDGGKRFIFSVPIIKGDEVRAVLIGGYDEQDFSRMLVSEAFAGQSTSFFCDSYGNIIVGSTNADYMFGEGNPLAGYDNILEGFSVAQPEENSSIADMAVDLHSGVGGIFQYSIAGRSRYMIYEPLYINDWFIINAVSSEVVDASVRSITLPMLYILIAVLLFAVSTISFISLRERKNARRHLEEEERLRISEQQYRIVMEQSEKNVFRYDINSRVSYRDQTTTDNFGMPERIENVPESVLHLIAEEDHALYLDFFAQMRSGQPTASVVVRMMSPDGQLRWYRSDATTIFDSIGRPAQVIVAYYDVTEQREMEMASEKDPLTGALNRVSFKAYAEALLREGGEQRQHAFIMLDLDKFKRINDCFGHAVGDEALVLVAQKIRSLLRSGDLLARMGGDEYFICMKDIPNQAVVARRVGQLCQVLHTDVQDGVSISASLGVALYPQDGLTFDELYRHADAALYQVKQSGRDSFCFYRPEMGEQPPANP